MFIPWMLKKRGTVISKLMDGSEKESRNSWHDKTRFHRLVESTAMHKPSVLTQEVDNDTRWLKSSIYKKFEDQTDQYWCEIID